MAEINQDKLKALETAVGQIERQFGKGAIMRLGQQEAVNVNVIPAARSASTRRSVSAGYRAAG
jgi:recombination protein RecA